MAGSVVHPVVNGKVCTSPNNEKNGHSRKVVPVPNFTTTLNLFIPANNLALRRVRTICNATEHSPVQP